MLTNDNTFYTLLRNIETKQYFELNKNIKNIISYFSDNMAIKIFDLYKKRNNRGFYCY
jgi:hypothetical protein